MLMLITDQWSSSLQLLGRFLQPDQNVGMRMRARDYVQEKRLTSSTVGSWVSTVGSEGIGGTGMVA